MRRVASAFSLESSRFGCFPYVPCKPGRPRDRRKCKWQAKEKCLMAPDALGERGDFRACVRCQWPCQPDSAFPDAAALVVYVPRDYWCAVTRFRMLTVSGRTKSGDIGRMVPFRVH